MLIILDRFLSMLIDFVIKSDVLSSILIVFDRFRSKVIKSYRFLEKYVKGSFRMIKNDQKNQKIKNIKKDHTKTRFDSRIIFINVHRQNAKIEQMKRYDL